MGRYLTVRVIGKCTVSACVRYVIGERTMVGVECSDATFKLHFK